MTRQRAITRSHSNDLNSARIREADICDECGKD